MVVGIAGSVLLFAIALFHVYWLCGGKVGADRSTPLDKQGNRWNPGKLATAASAIVFLVAGLIPLISLHIIAIPIPVWIIGIVLILGMIVLLARGLGLLVVSLRQPKPRDIFHRYNIALYTPICLFLALAYFACLFYSGFHILPDRAAYAEALADTQGAAAASTSLSGTTVDAATSQLLSTYFKGRASEVCGAAGSSMKACGLSLSAGVLSAADARAYAFGAMAHRANLVVKSADAAVDIRSVKKEGDTLTLDVYEWTSFSYDDLADGAGGTDDAAFGTEHRITLRDTAGSIAIISDAYDEGALSGIDTTSGQVVSTQTVSSAVTSNSSDMTASSEGLSVSATSANYESGYDPMAAILYADAHTFHPNKAYHNFNDSDCANFTSQSLYAGGLKQRKGSYSSTSKWYYSSGKYSSSWVYCPSFVAYMRQHGKYIRNPKESQIYPGSPVVYNEFGNRWSHATICVGYDSAGTPVLDAHSWSYYHVPYICFSAKVICTIQMTPKQTVGKSFYSATSNGKTVTSSSPIKNSNADRFKWTTAGDGYVTLSRYSGTSSSLDVPKEVIYKKKTYKVRYIGTGAFKNNKHLISVHIGSQIKAIFAKAFYGDTKLTSVDVASTDLRAVYASAFYSCTALQNLELHSKKLTAVMLGKNSFSKVNSRAKIHVPSGKVKTYRTWFRSRGLSKKVSVVKL